MLTTGRRDLQTFYDVPGVELLLARCVDPPVEQPPPHVEVLLDRGPYTVEGERELLRSRRIDVLVTKNSGGSLTAAKLVAARSLGLPVVVVERPVVAPGARPPAVVHDVDAAAAWVRAHLPR
jgi:precorrin-6A/cobalt-precorrin-6A reductase